MNTKSFELKNEHILLLQNMYWEYEDAETGGPSVNGKRPYGNSYVPPDVADILDIKLPDEDEKEYDKVVENIMKFHYESHTALQIILQNKTFKTGLYKNIAGEYSKPKWKKIDEE